MLLLSTLPLVRVASLAIVGCLLLFLIYMSLQAKFFFLVCTFLN
jgi:hypothetical protein